MVRLLAYCARGDLLTRGFDSRTVQTFVCLNMSVCIGSGRFLCIVCMYLQKQKYISMYIYPLSRIHNTSLTSAYFGLDKRECECLECLFIYLFMCQMEVAGHRKHLRLRKVGLFHIPWWC
jgi:hypothetical protein